MHPLSPLRTDYCTGKFHVDDYIREKGFPAVFLYTGNFYENMVFRSHMKYNRDLDRVEFHQAVIKETTKCECNPDPHPRHS